MDIKELLFLPTRLTYEKSGQIGGWLLHRVSRLGNEGALDNQVAIEREQVMTDLKHDLAFVATQTTEDDPVLGELQAVMEFAEGEDAPRTIQDSEQLAHDLNAPADEGATLRLFACLDHQRIRYLRSVPKEKP